jgi:hypothetical protein
MKVKIEIDKFIDFDVSSDTEIKINQDLVFINNEVMNGYIFEIASESLRITDYLYLRCIENIGTKSSSIMFNVSFLHTKYHIPIKFEKHIQSYPNQSQLELIILESINLIIEYYKINRQIFNINNDFKKPLHI